jgi:hypothetical protein
MPVLLWGIVPVSERVGVSLITVRPDNTPRASRLRRRTWGISMFEYVQHQLASAARGAPEGSFIVVRLLFSPELQISARFAASDPVGAWQGFQVLIADLDPALWRTYRGLVDQLLPYLDVSNLKRVSAQDMVSGVTRILHQGTSGRRSRRPRR